MSGFSKVLGYKLNVQKPYFYRNQPVGKQKLKSNYLYRSIKHLAINVTKDMKDLHVKRRKAERGKRNANIQKIYGVDGLEDSELLKCQHCKN